MPVICHVLPDVIAFCGSGCTVDAGKLLHVLNCDSSMRHVGVIVVYVHVCM